MRSRRALGGSGNPREAFGHFVIQDTLHLGEYARALALLAANMAEHVEVAARYEWMFWDGDVRGERWPW